MLKRSTIIKPSSLKEALPGEPPKRLEPQLLTLSDSPPEGEDWLHEIKHDGYRLTVTVRKEDVCLWTRNGYD